MRGKIKVISLYEDGGTLFVIYVAIKKMVSVFHHVTFSADL